MQLCNDFVVTCQYDTALTPVSEMGVGEKVST